MSVERYMLWRPDVPGKQGLVVSLQEPWKLEGCCCAVHQGLVIVDCFVRSWKEVTGTLFAYGAGGLEGEYWSCFKPTALLVGGSQAAELSCCCMMVL